MHAPGQHRRECIGRLRWPHTVACTVQCVSSPAAWGALIFSVPCMLASRDSFCLACGATQYSQCCHMPPFSRLDAVACHTCLVDFTLLHARPAREDEKRNVICLIWYCLFYVVWSAPVGGGTAPEGTPRGPPWGDVCFGGLPLYGGGTVSEGTPWGPP